MAVNRGLGVVVCVAIVVLGMGVSANGVAFAQKAGKTADQAAAKADAPKKMTKEQAEELFKQVDVILKYASDDSKLPIVHSVKRTLISREDVTHFLMARFDEDESAKRLQRSEIVLKKFGLLDRDFHLRPFLISLLTEQIAGFYDSKTKTVNMLDWIEPEEQEPVLAHELTHALQDQRVGLLKWASTADNLVGKNVADDNRHIQTDEADTAREAVTEGQAMAVFVDFSLDKAKAGKKLADMPDEMFAMMQSATGDSASSPILARAPLLLQQSLLFPYSAGLGFERELLRRGGAKMAFADALDRPPTSSAEILHPEIYIARTPVPVLRLPDLHPLIDAEYAPYDVGVMGEQDVHMLTELFGGKQIADALAPAWAGGIYYAAQRRSAVTAAAKDSQASLGLIYFSRWKNPDSARSFMRVYAGQLGRKYSGLARDKKREGDGGEQVYTTAEGDVLLTISGSDVFISEGFDLEVARTMRGKIAAVQGDGVLQVAGSREVRRELGVSLGAMLGEFGTMRAGVEMGR